ncbi:MAG TPA: glycosyltransferase [Actinomycetota bacterium]
MSGALFVLPAYPGRSASVDPFWITADGLTRALATELDGADILTPAGMLPGGDVAARALGEHRPSAGRRAVRRLPTFLRPMAGDLRAWRRARAFRTMAVSVPSGPYRLVVQLHRRFHDAGRVVARRSAAPFVLKVEALEVREEEAWGVRRLGWRRLVESKGEVRIFRSADLLAPISPEVDAHLAGLGIPEDRRVLLPSAVDTEMFSPGPPDPGLRAIVGPAPFVAGWVGGMRPFHGLDMVPEVTRALRAQVPGAVLALVGSGPLRPWLDEVAGDGIRPVDPVPHREVGSWLRTFDACVLLSGGADFHYSPLKLYEYLASGRPVVAPRIGEMAGLLTDGRDALLVPPGDPGAVASALARLAGNPVLAERIGRAGRELAERQGSWRSRARTLLDALATRGLLERSRHG